MVKVARVVFITDEVGGGEKTKLKGEILLGIVSMKQLLEAGVHFGHQTRRWNPKMKPYIYTNRNGIYIIDLQKTLKSLKNAYDFVRNSVMEGKSIIFVGTKKQAQAVIKEEAERCGAFYVNQRWLGGMLTNFSTIRKRVERLKELEEMEGNGTFDVLPKKEVSKLRRELDKLRKYLGGVKDMEDIPDMIYIVDTRKEKIAIAEARKLSIPVIAILDTNCDPDVVDYPIPGNDDAIRAIKLITSVIASAVLEGREGMQTKEMEKTENTVAGEGETEEEMVGAEVEVTGAEAEKVALGEEQVAEPEVASEGDTETEKGEGNQ